MLLTWNSRGYLPRLLPSLSSQVGVDLAVHVVDNGSTDGTLAALSQYIRPASVHRFSSNRGFAHAANLGISQGDRPFVLLVNHDAILNENYCIELVRALENHARAGSATGKLVRAVDGGFVIDSAGHTVLRSGHAINRGSDEPDHGQYDCAEPIFGVSAAAAMYRRSALRDVAVGGEVFPANFFAYNEDVDLDFRLRWRAWLPLYVPLAVATHERMGNSDERKPLFEDHARKNHVLLLIREFDRSWFLHHSGEIFGYILWDTYHLFRRPRRLRYLVLTTRALGSAMRARRFIRRRRLSDAGALERWLVPTNHRWLPPRLRSTRAQRALASRAAA